MLCKYHNLPDELDDIHSHFESFKVSIETDFKHLKEATSRNVQNIQTSLTIQQMYSTTLCTHINTINNRLAKIEKQVQQHCMYPDSQIDAVQINGPEYDSDIDGDNQPHTHNNRVIVSVQGILMTPQEPSIEEDDNSTALGNATDTETHQETDWPHAPTVQIPGVSSMTSDQPQEVTYNIHQTQPSPANSEIPELKEDSDQDQFADPTFLINQHNTHQ